jgi:hypothetical protein
MTKEEKGQVPPRGMTKEEKGQVPPRGMTKKKINDAYSDRNFYPQRVISASSGEKSNSWCGNTLMP